MKKFLLSIFAVLFAFAGVQAQSYVKVTSAPADWSGDYLIVYEAGNVAFNGGLTTLDAANNKVNVVINGDNIAATDATNAIKFTITKSGTSYTIKSASGYYIGNTADSNKLNSSKSTEYANTISLNTDGTVQIVGSGGSVLRYNANSGNYRFRYFKSGTYTSQKAIALYKYTESTGGETPAPVDVAEPTFTPADGATFEESLDVTIAAEEGLAVYYSTDNKVSYTEGTSLNITETKTVYAYAEDAEGNKSDIVEATYTKIVPIDPNAVTETIVASETGIANGVAVETLKFGNVTATFDKGSNSNATKYYTSGTAFRAYGGNTITFTGDAGVTINSVVFTFGSGDGSNAITVDCGTYSDGTWTGASNKVVFAIGGTSGNRRLAKIAVTYSIEEGAVVIATPSITESTSFVGSTTVEITNNEEGTTLYYSTNGLDYVAYNGALNISETTTVYAKAVDAQGNESAVAKATYTKIEVLSIAEAKAAYDAVSANVAVAVDLTGAVVTVNNGQYLFIENETTGINIYNSGAKYAEGTKFTAGYILGTSTTDRNMHQLSNVEFCGVETTAVTVKPLEVTIADIAGNYDEYEGRFVKLTGVSIDADKNMTQGDDEYKAYDRFTLGFGAIANCDVTGVVAIYNTGEQLYIKDITYNLSVTAAGYATLFLDFNAAIPTNVEAYIIKEDGINNGYITLTQVTGVLPANTGIIVKAAEGNYTFSYAAEATANVEGNLLEGTATATEINVEAYVLGKVDGVVGLYKAEMNQMDGTAWLNNANKAYLPASALTPAQQTAAFYGFDWDGTTGIEQITENREQSTAIYDLTGRRIDAITAPGIYVVNGKKVLVK